MVKVLKLYIPSGLCLNEYQKHLPFRRREEQYFRYTSTSAIECVSKLVSEQMYLFYCYDYTKERCFINVRNGIFAFESGSKKGPSRTKPNISYIIYITVLMSNVTIMLTLTRAVFDLCVNQTMPVRFGAFEK